MKENLKFSIEYDHICIRTENGQLRWSYKLKDTSNMTLDEMKKLAKESNLLEAKIN